MIIRQRPPSGTICPDVDQMDEGRDQPSPGVKKQNTAQERYTNHATWYTAVGRTGWDVRGKPDSEAGAFWGPNEEVNVEIASTAGPGGPRGCGVKSC